jgi:hypothetical protein
MRNKIVTHLDSYTTQTASHTVENAFPLAPEYALVVSRKNTIKLIEMAESDARDRASIAFCRGCIHKPFSCRNGYSDMCPAKETYLKNYDAE